MNEYLCLTLLSNRDETQTAFQSRLYAFWSHILRTRPEVYEQVYSESVKFETENGCIARRYMVQPEAVTALQTELTVHAIAYLAVDRDDWYSQAEASSSEWFQID